MLKTLNEQPARRLMPIFIGALVMGISGCYNEKNVFDSPESGARAVIELACKGDTEGLAALTSRPGEPPSMPSADIIGHVADSCNSTLTSVSFVHLNEDLELRKYGTLAFKYEDGQTTLHNMAFNKKDGGWVIDSSRLSFNIPSEDDLALLFVPVFGSQLAAAISLYTKVEGEPPETVEDILAKKYLAGLAENPGGEPWLIDSKNKQLSVKLSPKHCKLLNKKIAAGDFKSEGFCENGAFVRTY